MRCRWSLALVVLALAVADARAQVLLGRGVYGYRGAAFGVGRLRGVGAYSVSVGGFYGLPVCAPPVYRQVTVIYTPPTVVVPDARLFLENLLGAGNLNPLADGPAEPMPRIGPGLPRPRAQAPPPANRPRAPAPPPKVEELPRPKPEPPPEKPQPPPAKKLKPAPEKKPEPPKRPKAPLELPRPPLPEDDPQAENARLIALGQQAFAAGEYGRASQRFRQAIAAQPKDAVAPFLLAQALFALGKYQAAVDAIHAGMALQPDWPAFRFQPLALYGPNVADYPDHLHRLEDTLHRHPDDPILLFLYAYELWFDGRRDEARVLFQRARPGAADPGVIDRFLRALPPAPVL